MSKIPLSNFEALVERNDIIEEDLELSYGDDTAAFMSSAATSVSRNMCGISETGNVVQSKRDIETGFAQRPF
ncbi:755_t:CDS:1, partial [Paraglomus brasilianum]